MTVKGDKSGPGTAELGDGTAALEAEAAAG
ncbi:MAG: hypothetical protein QOC80_2015, partial [Frankiaceae bacterium]|nr:hypothetical protein [Frankiaceae bacterium]